LSFGGSKFLFSTLSQLFLEISFLIVFNIIFVLHPYYHSMYFLIIIQPNLQFICRQKACKNHWLKYLYKFFFGWNGSITKFPAFLYLVILLNLTSSSIFRIMKLRLLSFFSKNSQIVHLIRCASYLNEFNYLILHIYKKSRRCPWTNGLIYHPIYCLSFSFNNLSSSVF
jgi:hypothetical protein